MKKNTFNIFYLLLFGLLLVNWGNVGHRNINYKSAMSFTPFMPGFGVWADSLSLHASDADIRKSVIIEEKIRHYIDIDNYPEFNLTGRISAIYDSIVSIHGESFVKKNGTLPWATKLSYDSLKNCFKRLDWKKAMLFASDLGHYVADGHMPLHLTSNYDGYATGQAGIHNRYESNMVYTYLSSLTNYKGDSVKKVNNINQYIMNYIYRSEVYVDSVLIADNYATKLTGSTNSTSYYSALWSKTRFTTYLFSRASFSLAELIYNAWLEAGKPAFLSNTISNGLEVHLQNKTIVYPNPTNGIINIKEINLLKVELFSVTGVYISTFYNNKIDISHLKNGLFLLNIYANNGVLIKEKLMLQSTP